jgi:hypothetical protein
VIRNSHPDTTLGISDQLVGRIAMNVRETNETRETRETSETNEARETSETRDTSAPAAIVDASPPARGRTVSRLVWAYAALSALAVVVAEAAPAGQADATRTHAIIVLAGALVTCRFAARALRGNRRALLRLRIAAVVEPVAIAVVIAIPGDFPLWMMLEQAVGFVLLVAVAALLRRGVTTSMA